MFKVRLVLALALLYAGAMAHAQGNSEAAHVQSLNNSLLRLYGQLQALDASRGASIRSQASQVIAERFAALQTLIAEDPAAALQLAFDENLLAGLAVAFPDSASQLESQGIWEGPVEYVIFDDPTMTKHRVDIRMSVAANTYDIHFPEHEPGWLKCGDILNVAGVKVGNQVAAADGSVAGSVAAAGCSKTGDQKIVAILVQFPGYSLPATVTPAMVHSIMFATTGRSVNTFWQESSYGNASASGVVLGPYLLSQNYTCDQYDAIRAAAMAAADPDVNFTQYTRIMIVFPQPAGCGWAGLGMLGCGSYSSGDGSFTASTSWLVANWMGDTNNGTKLTTHEGGHNLTLHHASSRAFTNSATGLPETLGPMGTAGSLSEYGDLFNTMGSWNFGQYNAPHKVMLGWLTLGTTAGSNVQQVESNGSFSIQPFENTPGLAAVKVRRGTGNNGWLWLEYRQPIGQYDSAINSQVWNGALVHYEDSTTGTHSHLLDMTPGSGGGFNDPAKTVGTFTDSYSNVSFSVDSVSSSAMNVSVFYGPVPCVAANPTVSISPSNPSAQEDTPINYTVTVTNNDTSGCTASDFSLNSTEPTSPTTWGTTLIGSLNIAPGQSASTSMVKKSPVGTPVGTYGVNASASHTGGGATGTAYATIIVKPVTIVTTSGTYKPRSTVTMTAAVTSGGNPASGASVTFVLTKPNGTTTKTVTANTSGVAVWKYKLSPRDPNGDYSATGQATFNGLTGDPSAPATFKVQ